MQNSRSVKRRTENINIILKAEKENKSEKKKQQQHQHKKKSVSENYLANDKMHFALVFIIVHCAFLCRGNHFWLAVVSNLYERVRHSMTLINNFLLLMLVELFQCWSYIKERQCTCLKSTTTFSAIEQLRNER